MKKSPNKDEKRGFSFARLSRGALTALGCVFAVVIVLVGALVGVFFALKTAGRASMTDRRNDWITAETDYVYDPDVISYGGKKYRMNRELTTLLFMGVDTGKEEYSYDQNLEKWCRAEMERTGESYEQVYNRWAEWRKRTGQSTELYDADLIAPGQADVLLLLVLDEKSKHVSIISIDRNAMSYYETFDHEGNSIGTSEGQLALAYSYGDGAHESCRMTVDAVSDFLYEIPVHAYYSMKYEAIKQLNDAVGGVEVTVPIDMTAVDERLIAGNRVTLDGELAEKYLSARRDVGDGSNAGRLERQKGYILSFIDTAVDAVLSDITLPLELYDKLASNSCTDLSADEVVYLADLATKVDVSFHSIKGTTDESSAFAEFRPDEDALWQLIIDIFYICEE